MQHNWKQGSPTFFDLILLSKHSQTTIECISWSSNQISRNLETKLEVGVIWDKTKHRHHYYSKEIDYNINKQYFFHQSYPERLILRTRMVYFHLHILLLHFHVGNLLERVWSSKRTMRFLHFLPPPSIIFLIPER